MRRIVIGLMSTLSGLVLLFSYHTSTNSGTALASSGGTGAGASGSAGASSGSSSGSSGSADSSAGSSSASGTYTGDAAQTRWGPVQVQITVENGKITKAEAVSLPAARTAGTSEINSYAIPTLNEEAVDGAERADRRDLRRHRDERGLHPVTPVGDRPGPPVTAVVDTPRTDPSAAPAFDGATALTEQPRRAFVEQVMGCR